jgi:hypothetical protein
MTYAGDVSWAVACRWVALSLVGLTGACALLVDTDGLSTGDPITGAPGQPDATTALADGAAPDAKADADAGADADGRVTNGLVAFFSFTEDAGNVVHDTAPEGDHLELGVERAPAPDGDGGTIPAATSGPTITWTSPGMSVVGRVLIASAVNASTIESRCGASGEITVEAWLEPAKVDQYGPARIVTMSFTGSVPNRNFTLGQDGDHYIFRLRNKDIDAGVVERPSDGGVALALTHVAVTARANGEMTFWIDGARTTHVLPAGAFGFQPFRLALANEIDGFTFERSWRGDYRLVAVYCRALSEAELAHNRALGPTP